MLAVGLLLVCAGGPQILAEEDIYTYEPADNGAGPLWCYGASCIVRSGERVFVSGLETIPGAKPLNNTRWVLYERTADGWVIRRRDDEGRTREPCPIVLGPGGQVFLSANPTLTPPDTYNGPARPEVMVFDPADAGALPRRELPSWDGEPAFTEHSYRTFAADARTGELVLFNVLGHEGYHWSRRDAAGNWSAHGFLKFPWGADYATPESIRLCYPEIVLRDGACWFLGISDIIEPYPEWRAFKRELTGQQWDYDFRRLFIAASSALAGQPFGEWLEVASRDKTCGWISNLDLLVTDDGDVHVLWRERSCDVRLRERFFPGTPLTYELKHAVLRGGQVAAQETILAGGEGLGTDTPEHARFHLALGGRLFVFGCVNHAGTLENWLWERRDGGWSAPVKVPFVHPFTNFMTAGPRNGHAPSEVLDLYGECAGVARTLRYGRVRVDSAM